MIRTISTLIAAFMFCCPLFAYVQADNGPVVVVVKEKEPIRDPHTNRAPARSQVECYYYSYGNAIELSFLSNLGTVNVVLENQTTSEIRNCSGVCGLCIT